MSFSSSLFQPSEVETYYDKDHFQFFLISTFHIRCDKEVGVIGVDVSKERLITSRGRVRKYENDLKGYEEILKNFMVSRS